MPISRAEIVTTAIVQCWEQLAASGGVPMAGTIRDVRATIATMVAQELVEEIFSGLVDVGEGREHLVMAQRWRFAPYLPPLRACWPSTTLPGGDLRFILRVRPSTCWAELPAAERRTLERALSLSQSPSGLVLPGRLWPVWAQRLPQGDYLVGETLLSPPALSGGDR